MPISPDKLLQTFEPKPLKVLEPTRQMYVVRFSPCGKYLLAGGYDGLVHRWDVSQEKMPELAPAAGHAGWVCGLAFHPQDRKTVFTADSWGQARCWAYADEKPQAKWKIERAHDGWIHDLAVSRDGRLVATCGIDRHVRVWSVGDAKPVQDFAHTEDFLSVAFHPDGKSIVGGDVKGKVKHWDLSSGKLVRDIDAAALYKLDRLQDVGGVWRLAFDEHGQTLAAAGVQQGSGATVQGVPLVLLLDWPTGKQKHSLALGDKSDCFVHDLLLHAEDFVMAVTSGTPGRGKLVFWRPGEAKPFFETTKMPNCHSLALDPAGRRLAVSATSANSNGNGRQLRNGEYAGNSSPIHILRLGQSV
jgi:WD40 repeat protein